MHQKTAIIRVIAAVICALLVLWFLGPLVTGIRNPGMVFAVPAFLFFLWAVWPKFYHWTFGKNRLRGAVVRGIVVLGVAVVAVGLGLMIWGASRPQDASSQTVIVLGSKIYGETPGRSLTNRLDCALEYLDENPDCDVIVTGGQGRGEDISNGEAMRRYLIENGIDAARIFVEPNAGDTEQNLRFSAQIISANGLDEHVVIVTDRYHQYRGGYFARRQGLIPSPQACTTHWLELASCCGREVLAIWRAFLLGY